MELKVIGAGCDNCTRLYQNTAEAVKQLGLDADIEKVEDLMEIIRLGVMSAPSLMADGKLIVSGRVPSADKIAALLQKESQDVRL